MEGNEMCSFCFDIHNYLAYSWFLFLFIMCSYFCFCLFVFVFVVLFSIIRVWIPTPRNMQGLTGSGSLLHWKPVGVNSSGRCFFHSCHKNSVLTHGGRDFFLSQSAPKVLPRRLAVFCPGSQRQWQASMLAIQDWAGAGLWAWGAWRVPFHTCTKEAASRCSGFRSKNEK
jgi:hypothetical protein